MISSIVYMDVTVEVSAVRNIKGVTVLMAGLVLTALNANKTIRLTPPPVTYLVRIKVTVSTNSVSVFPPSLVVSAKNTKSTINITTPLLTNPSYCFVSRSIVDKVFVIKVNATAVMDNLTTRHSNASIHFSPPISLLPLKLSKKTLLMKYLISFLIFQFYSYSLFSFII